MPNTIQCASLEAFLLYDYQEKMKEIATSDNPTEILSEFQSNFNLDSFYKEHKNQIDAVVEQVFYDSFVGYPQCWFSLATRWGFNILKIQEAQRFYALIAIKTKAKELLNR